MTFAEAKSIQLKPDIEPLQVTMEWACRNPQITYGGHISREVEYQNGKLHLSNESIDTIILHKNKHFECNPVPFLTEARRVLKRNGKIILYFHNQDSETLLGKMVYKFFNAKKSDAIEERHIVASMDALADMINALELLIDKNSIEDKGIIAFEIIKRENEKIAKIVGKA